MGFSLAASVGSGWLQGGTRVDRDQTGATEVATDIPHPKYQDFCAEISDSAPPGRLPAWIMRLKNASENAPGLA